MRKRQIEGRCEGPRDQNVPIGSVRSKQLTAIVSLEKIYEIRVSILMSVLDVKTFIAIS